MSEEKQTERERVLDLIDEEIAAQRNGRSRFASANNEASSQHAYCWAVLADVRLAIASGKAVIK